MTDREHKTIVDDKGMEVEQKARALTSDSGEVVSNKYVPPDPKFGGILGGHYEAELRRRKP